MSKHIPTSSDFERTRYLLTGLLILFSLALSGCEQVEDIRASFDRTSPHERYAASLAEAGLAETALGRAWHAAAQRALNEAPLIDLPFRETHFFDPATPAAAGFRFEVERGRQLLINVAPQPGDTSRHFIDLFETPLDSADAPRHLQSADTTHALTFDVRRPRTYVLRVQPELLRGGQVTVTIQTDASLAFPVAGKDSDAIRSFFGASRDGGRRRHHGVDIFAPRGTPALAAADGFVTRVRTGGLGGKTVWLRDDAGYNLYYAHLDTQMVRQGQRMAVGDTVGLVGNTGNARTTPPHLHFGIYSNGPLNPLPFIYQSNTAPPEIRVDTSRFGMWARVATSEANLRTAPTTSAGIHQTIARHTALYVTGGSGSWYRVRLPDAAEGYLSAALIEPAQQPVRQTRLAAAQALRHRPTPDAPVLDSLTAETTTSIFAHFDTFLYVESPAGRAGWIAGE